MLHHTCCDMPELAGSRPQRQIRPSNRGGGRGRGDSGRHGDLGAKGGRDGGGEEVGVPVEASITKEAEIAACNLSILIPVAYFARVERIVWNNAFLSYFVLVNQQNRLSGLNIR
jgi:hypothetical protein